RRIRRTAQGLSSAGGEAHWKRDDPRSSRPGHPGYHTPVGKFRAMEVLEITQTNSVVNIAAEQPSDVRAREALLDRAMGLARTRKASEKLRRGYVPSRGLAFVARDEAGLLLGTVRLWDVRPEIGDPMLLLGPLAVEPSIKS